MYSKIHCGNDAATRATKTISSQDVHRNHPRTYINNKPTHSWNMRVSIYQQITAHSSNMVNHTLLLHLDVYLKSNFDHDTRTHTQPRRSVNKMLTQPPSYIANSLLAGFGTSTSEVQKWVSNVCRPPAAAGGPQRHSHVNIQTK